jgi:helix-turn-helix protein
MRNPEAQMKSGDPFNPWSGGCGFFPQDVVGRQSRLTNASGNPKPITDGPKRLYERLVRFAGRDGKCFPGQEKLAAELGKSVRQVRRDLAELEAFGLIRHAWRDGRRSNTYEFLWHGIFESERTCMSAQSGDEHSVERTSLSGQNSEPAWKAENLNGHPGPFERTYSTDLSGRVRPPTSSIESMQRKHQETRCESLNDDDEKLPTQRLTVCANPKDELREIYRNATGVEINNDVLRRFFETIEAKGVPIADAMDELRERHVPHLDRWKNPDGLLTDFAKNIRSKVRNPPVMPELMAVSAKVHDAGPCQACRGVGYRRYDPDPARREYCDCALGRDLKRIDDRKTAEAAKNSDVDRMPVVTGVVQ